MTLAYERARSAQDYRFGQPSWYVRPLIRSFRWMVTNNAFLFAVAIAIVGGSFTASAMLDAWHWFQRSGALLVSIGAILSTQHMLRTVTGTLLNIPRAVSANPQEHKDLVTCFVGFWVVGLGTLIWAYGDLAGCLFGSRCL
ncbi:MAG: hypothetical protein O7F71_00915 [Gammaproteobacteria bacterium]|nr:hypothetical protein [Gammaproteobacteria bacterium]